MRALAASIVLLAACGADGVSIEVHRGSTQAERVELYLVEDHCVTDGERCIQLKTPSARSRLDGDVFARENATTFAAPVGGDGVAYFTIQPGTSDVVPRAIAVGFSGDTIVGAVLMPDTFYATDTQRRIVTLDAVVENVVSGQPASDGLRAETWYQPEGGGSCLAFEKTKGGEVHREFIVPASDPDCDDFVAPLECDALWPSFSMIGTDAGAQFTCVADVSAGNGMKACQLGNSGCTDGIERADCTPTKPANDPHRYCVPSTVCADAPLGCNGGAQSCAFTKLRRPDGGTLLGMTRVHCTVPVTPFNAASNAVCSNVATVLQAPFLPPATPACTGVSFAPVTDAGFGPFVSVENNLDVHITEQCALSLIFQEQFALDATSYLDDYVIKVDLANGTSLVAPLVIDLIKVSECDTSGAATCVIEGPALDARDESFVACGRM